MSDQEDFYLILPSNSSSRMYPDNVTANYITYLPHEIQLQGRWSVSLVEVQVPYNFLHLRKEDSRIVCVNLAREEGKDRLNGIIRSCEGNDPGLYHPGSDINGMRYDMFHGFCKSPEELVDNVSTAVNRVFSAMKGHIGTDYTDRFRADVDEVNDPEEHIRFKLKHGLVVARCVCKCPVIHYVCLTDKLREILGLKRRVIYLGRSHFIFPLPVALNRAAPDQLFIYCDLSESHVVGDSVSPLLRVVALDNAPYGTNIVKTFVTPHYYPSLKSNFRTVEIDIRDSRGKVVPFDYGTLTCVLHLKKIYQ